MYVSDAHYLMTFGPDGDAVLVPLSYVTILHSYHAYDGTTEEQVFRLALAENLGYMVVGPIDLDGPYNRDGGPMPQYPFWVVEYESYFALRHRHSEEHPLGDGVDTLTFDEGPDDKPITLVPGTIGFAELWTEAMNENPSETLEAYFPHLAD